MYGSNSLVARPKMTLAEMIHSFRRNRALIYQMSRREVIGRYRGSYLGLLWSFLHPLLMLSVYTFVFSVVFTARWGAATDNKAQFGLVLFAGLIVHGFLAECANRAPSIILNNSNYVKKVVFPLEIFAWIATGSALFHAGISACVLLCFYWLTNWTFSWTVVLFPLVLLPLAILTTGLVWFLAAMGVFLRDIGQTIGIVTTALLFLSPVFYPVAALPTPYNILIYVNPITFIIEQARAVLIWGILPDWTGLGVYTAVALLISWGGFAAFQKARRGFADVL